MSIEKPQNERQELYEAFRQHLKNPSNNAFFDADDLVIIIDQAVDIDDTYVQIEAVIQGLKYFPDNEEINVRKGFLFYNIECDEGVADTLAQKRGSSPLWTILKLRLEELNLLPEQADELLTKVLNDAEQLDDELAIQIVDAAAATMRHDWLMANETQLRAKTEYLPSLLYEMYNVLTRSSYRDHALQILDELVDMEPFVVDFWIAQAREQWFDGQNDKALISIDYALAIESDNHAAIGLKASLLEEANDHQAIFELLDPVKGVDGVFESVTEAIAYFYALLNQGKTQEAYDVLDANFQGRTQEFHIVDAALRNQHPKALQFLKEHMKETDDMNRWFDSAREFYAREFYTEAAMIYMAANMVHGSLTPEQKAILSSAIYLSGNYEAVITTLEQYIEAHDQSVPTDLVLAGLLAAIKVGGKRQVKKLFEGVKSLMPLQISSAWTLMSPLTQFGFSTFMHSLEMDLKQPGKLSFDFDMFTPPPIKF